MAAGHPFRHGKRAVGHVSGRVQSPGFAGLFHHGLAHRRRGDHRNHLVKIRAGIFQFHHKGIRVRGRNAQLGGVHLAVGDGFKIFHRFQHGGSIRRSGIGVRHALPAVHVIRGGQIAAVGPFQALAQMEGPGHAVLGHFPALRLAGNNPSLLVHTGQCFKGMQQHFGAVHRAVQRRVQRIRIRAELHHRLLLCRSRRLGFGRRRGRGRCPAASGQAQAQRQNCRDPFQMMFHEIPLEFDKILHFYYTENFHQCKKKAASERDGFERRLTLRYLHTGSTSNRTESASCRQLRRSAASSRCNKPEESWPCHSSECPRRHAAR